MSNNPVLLIHGIWDTRKKFARMSRFLEMQGWTVHSLDLSPNNGDTRLEPLAEQVEAYVDQTFPATQPIDLVGFSMGGIVSRYYVQRLSGGDRVQRFITLSSPHHGTWIAYGCDRPGCVQMRPNSAFLQDLNRDLTSLEKLNFTSIWTPLDAMIVPASSSEMPVGQNLRLWVPFHALMVFDPRSLKAVSRALQEPYGVSRSQKITLHS